MRRRSFTLLLFSLPLFLALGGGNIPRVYAEGASLYLSPVSGSFVVGDTFTVSINLDTGGQAVNAIEADLSFPPDKLQVVSPTSGSSFIQVWVNPPTFSNSEGTLHFAGVVQTPGITTQSGVISTVTFRVMNTGTAVIKFTDGSQVLLNDGLGTNVLTQTTNGIYYLILPPPQGPIVTSPTNPDQGTWYPSNPVVFRWTAQTPTVQGFSYVLNDAPVDQPDDISEGTSTQIAYNTLSDGVHYFHIKALVDGTWGGTTDYAVRVDNTPPAAFSINISPGDVTTSHSPVIQFVTTDAASGIDHYALQIIPLDAPMAEATQNTTPFFIEASSPYVQNLDIGDYDVVVRAYDLAGNYYQATQRLSIVNPVFQIIGTEGLRLAGSYIMPWPYVAIAALLILALLLYIMRTLWKLHRRLEHSLERGAVNDPNIARKLAELKERQQEYGGPAEPPGSDLGSGPDSGSGPLAAILLLISLFGAGLMLHHSAFAATGSINQGGLLPAPPIINLSPSSLSNNEVLYLGGWANVPNASVVIYIEQMETGDTFSGAATTDASGNWFYSFPQLLDIGHYAAWAELKSGDTLSPPSARVTIAVEPTALQIGNARFSYEELYLILFVSFLIVTLILIVLVLYRARLVRSKKLKLEALIREAEESLSRGFSLLRRDIELEIAAVQKAKASGEFSAEEKAWEEKLMKDLESVDSYIGKEIWKIEEEGRKL